MLSFRTACLVTGGLFVVLPGAVLLSTASVVELYIHDPADWPLAIDHFRFIAALNLTVGALLLALSRGLPDLRSRLRVAVATCLGVGILAAAHVVVLAAQAARSGSVPRWNAALYADATFFALVTLYWLAVALGLRRAASSSDHATV